MVDTNTIKLRNKLYPKKSQGDLNIYVEGRTVIVTENVSENLYLASRNNKRIVEVVDVSGISPAALVGADAVLMTVDSVKKFEEWLA